MNFLKKCNEAFFSLPGSFLAAYLVCLLFVAIPLGYLECGLAQFSNNSVIGIWSLVPLFRGIGWSTVVGCLYWGATTVGLAAPWFHYLIAQNEPSLLQVILIMKNGSVYFLVFLRRILWGVPIPIPGIILSCHEQLGTDRK